MFDTARDPEFWRAQANRLPPWLDEVGTLLLIVLGVVMLTALLNSSSEASFAKTVSHIQRQLFGNGAYVFALSVIATGVVILLPKFGLSLRLGWTRIAAIEMAFGALLALLHLFANDPQPRALAEEGKGGGYVGWALTQLTSSLGDTISLVIFGLLLLAGVLLALELRLYHVVDAVHWLRDELEHRVNRLNDMRLEQEYDPAWDNYPADQAYQDNTYSVDNGPSKPVHTHTAAARLAPSTAAPDVLPRRPSVVARDVDPAPAQTTAPAVQTAATAPDAEAAPKRNTRRTTTKEQPSPATKAQSANPQASPVAESTPDASGDDQPATPPVAKPAQNGSTTRSNTKKKPVARPLTAKEKKDLADHARKTMGAANGRSLVAPGDPGERKSIVPRDLLPDARVVSAAPRARVRRKTGDAPGERYFTVDDFRETKKVGKRNANLPPLELLTDIELHKPTEEEINTNARIIRHTLLEFDVETEVVDVNVGPTVTQYAVSPYTEHVNEDGERVLNRVRVSEITNLGGDLALALSARRLRIQAPVPGHSYVGIEVPNRQPSTVALRPVLESVHFYQKRKKALALPLGRDVSGEPFIADLGTMPHLLIAGTTGSGKSVMLAAMTVAFVLNNTPEDVQLVLLDPKMVELSRFNGLPHLLGPVETDLDRIIGVLRWATREMDRRYKLLEKEAARNLETYNNSLGRRRKNERLPYIVIIIDEIGDLMMMRPDETERTLTRLAQMARAVGIHLMVATQRPSVDVITGLIKANFPARVSFAVASSVDSRVILDTNGAETLMGHGDMLFLAPDAAGPRRVQGCFVSDDEVNAIVEHWKDWHAEQLEAEKMEPRGVAPWERGMTRREVLSETDPILEDAIALVIAEGEASASLIQRRLGLGYPRAARIIDMMHELGIIGVSKAGGRSREVLVKPGADPFKALVDKRIKNRKKG
ncbi:MAG: hypothetical protein K8S97_01215 [Anaerolineae bacterium]|nr:hypothetical protein [Anaerolineae bacterium]